MKGYSDEKCLSLLKVKGVSVVWSTLLTKKKNNNTQMPHSMKPPLPQSSQPCFSISYFFPLLGANCRRVAYIGMLLGLSCFKWNSLASTPPPPSSHNVTNTYILDGGKKKRKRTVQRQLAQIKCKETRQLQSQSRSADSALWTALMLQVPLQDRSCLLDKILLSGLDWRELVVNHLRKMTGWMWGWKCGGSILKANGENWRRVGIQGDEEMMKKGTNYKKESIRDTVVFCMTDGP